MEENVISLVSSDEEDNGLKSHRPKNTTVKKVKTKPIKSIDKIKPRQNINAQPTVVRIPRNNNTTQNVKVIQGYKEKQLLRAIQIQDGKSVNSHKTGNLSSGVTITPVVNANSHGNLNTSTNSLLLAKPKTNATQNVPKANFVKISPKIITTVPVMNVAEQPRPAKRINPIKISDAVTNRADSIEKSSDSDMLSRDGSVAPNDESTAPPAVVNQANGTNKPKDKDSDEPAAKRPKIANNEKKPIHDIYRALINACKAAEKSEEMKKVVDKLEKYYHRAHPEYVKSKPFLKLVKKVTNDVMAQPSLVYIKISSLLEELKTRRTMDSTNVTAEATATSEENPEVVEKNSKNAKRVERLSEALQKLQKKIRKSEEEEVDWDDEYNSNYLLTERYKKRAFEIYSKLCDLTGESRNAERIIKKPIKFRGTSFPEFNRKLEKFVNETKAFPDMFDVLRIMDSCNKEFNYRLSLENRRTVAQDAFTKIGNLLQKRRKQDLYEMVQYYTSNHKDPAGEDPDLKTKLDENHKHYSNRMNEVIDRFTMRQHGDSPSDEMEDSPNQNDVARNKRPRSTKDRNIPTTSAQSSTQTTTTTSERKESAPVPPSQLLLPVKMDQDIEINDDDDDLLIIPDEGLQLLGDDEMQEIEKVVSTDLFPTIASVTSLHPGDDHFDYLNTNPLEPQHL